MLACAKLQRERINCTSVYLFLYGESSVKISTQTDSRHTITNWPKVFAIFGCLYASVRENSGEIWHSLVYAEVRLDVVLKSLFFVFCKFVFVVVRSVWRDFSTRDNDKSREIRERSPNVLIRRSHLLAYADAGTFPIIIFRLKNWKEKKVKEGNRIRLNVVLKSLLSVFLNSRTLMFAPFCENYYACTRFVDVWQRTARTQCVR